MSNIVIHETIHSNAHTANILFHEKGII